ncbi:hypothetical protein Cfor_00338 [Coptotermes formosanus]|jgi:uncharacterized Zn-finger protein|uniref:C2H2-type domain-containing protein n=1 Tax=Coptotermes formosanus TaxID=36987 RepID=A0A6L2P9D7_COPFO|nr:hypothetical protein Cfor_00338 [Coptotermes formosanus]
MDEVKHEPVSDEGTTCTTPDLEEEEHLLPVTTLFLKSEIKEDLWDNSVNSDVFKEEVTIKENEECMDNGKQQRRFDGLDRASGQFDTCMLFQHPYTSGTDSTDENSTQNSEASRKDMRYKCELCDKVFSRSRAFAAHQRSHTPKKPYSCHMCNKSFTQKMVLENHCRIHHTGEKITVYDISKNRHSKKPTVKNQLIHCGPKPYKCDVCNKVFLLLDRFKKHYRIHTGEKPYVCDICNKGFSQRGNLATHKRTHTGEKPYNCDTCNMNFADGSTLKTHYRIHTGERPYICNICNKTFSKKGNLTNHHRVHTGEKPYCCVICNKSFSEKGNLKNHLRIHIVQKTSIG